MKPISREFFDGSRNILMYVTNTQFMNKLVSLSQLSSLRSNKYSERFKTLCENTLELT